MANIMAVVCIGQRLEKGEKGEFNSVGETSIHI